MLTWLTNPSHRNPCEIISRRHFLQVGTLGLGGLTLADLLRLKAQSAAPQAKARSIIMIYLHGGPSHIDIYDLKPDAPAEFRGEFKPIRTNVPGLDICELMPLQSKIADKFAVVRGIRCADGGHSAEEIMRGSTRGLVQRPVFGSVVSRLRGSTNEHGAPRYVALGGGNANDPGDPSYLGMAHKPFTGARPESLYRHPSVSADRLVERKVLLRTFDGLQRDLDSARGELAGVDAFQERALALIASPRLRDAFDIYQEPVSIRERYGRSTSLLQARRLVEAGASVVTLSMTGMAFHWDSHGNDAGRQIETNFDFMRGNLPLLDRNLYALVTDLDQRGLADDVLVVVWGEFGRTPLINKFAGRDHWPAANFVFFAGGGLKMGQAIGDTGPRGERERGRAVPYTPENVLATVYHVLGIDPAATLPDHSGRQHHLLDERAKIAELA